MKNKTIGEWYLENDSKIIKQNKDFPSIFSDKHLLYIWKHSGYQFICFDGEYYVFSYKAFDGSYKKDYYIHLNGITPYLKFKSDEWIEWITFQMKGLKYVFIPDEKNES